VPYEIAIDDESCSEAAGRLAILRKFHAHSCNAATLATRSRMKIASACGIACNS
jgi:hypothetical protein